MRYSSSGDAMKGKARFTRTQADQIRRLLRLVRRAEPGTPQKLLRDQLRALGFFISDWTRGSSGFTASDFDELAHHGAITITEDNSPGANSVARQVSKPSPAKPTARHTTVSASVPGVRGGLRELALAALVGPPIPINAAIKGAVPDRPGLYAVYGYQQAWRMLSLGEPPDDRPLYVGKAESSLVSRDLGTHFATGTTGRSSPRRSFAALLSASGVLELVAMPRRPHDPEPGKWTHYALDHPGDEQLTDWMRANLKVAFWACPPRTVLRPVETAVMRHWEPPLNLTGVSTAWTNQVKTARSVMAEQAKAWALKRGFHV